MVMAIGAGLAVSAKAETLLVDFGRSGISPKDHSAECRCRIRTLMDNYWNSLVPGPFYPNLIDFNNNPTTIGLGYTTAVGTDSFNGPAGVTSNPPTPAEIAATDIDAAALGNLGVKEAAMDFAASPGGLNNNTRFEISGLNASQTYTLTLFGSHKFSDDDITVYSVSNDAFLTTIGTANLLVQTPGIALAAQSRYGCHDQQSCAVRQAVCCRCNFVGSNGNLGYLNPSNLLASLSRVRCCYWLAVWAWFSAFDDDRHAGLKHHVYLRLTIRFL